MLRIQNLIDDAKCYEALRELRWPDGVLCPHCYQNDVIKRGFDETEPCRQRYFCNPCDRRFDDLTETVFSGHHQPLKTWILCLYFMGLNLSNLQIAQELSLNKDDVHEMASQLREGVQSHKAPTSLQVEVECDQAYVIAGHKGHPQSVKKADLVEEIASKVLGVEVPWKKKNPQSLE